MRLIRWLAPSLVGCLCAPAFAQGFTENFNDGIPDSWTVVDNHAVVPGVPDSSAAPWTTNDVELMDNYTGQPGLAATACSFNHPGQYDISLITHEFRVPSVPFGTNIAYNINYQSPDVFDFFDTNISINGGDWITMTHDAGSLGAFWSDGPPNIRRTISMAFFGAEPGDMVRVEFRYYSTFLLPMVHNEYVQIDSVEVVPSPGGASALVALFGFGASMRRRA